MARIITNRRPVTDSSSLGRPALLPASEFPAKKKKKGKKLKKSYGERASLMTSARVVNEISSFYELYEFFMRRVTPINPLTPQQRFRQTRPIKPSNQECIIMHRQRQKRVTASWKVAR